ncbi:MAG: DNA-processing protein DprA [Capnocytophaga sp.]|nr:DNA-processing protein DprA [Capnocytophaga sp.]
MSAEEIIALLALKNTPNIGDVTAKRLIAHCGSATQVFNEKSHKLSKIDGIGSVILSHISNPKYRKEAEAEWEYINQNNIQFYTFLDDDYPTNLKQIIDAPIIFFCNGNINLKDKKCISIVGTRQITSYGTAFCEKFIEELSVLEDLVIISGFAYGVDITAHKLAMEYNIPTIACLAHGLDTIYPASHKKYYSQMLENGGFITDFWHKSKFDRKNFLSRNRIIAGLSDATIVIESAIKGGSLVTADMAFGYNRDVFAVPGRASDVYSQGCNFLIKTDKARLINNAADVIYYMGWDTLPQKPKYFQPPLFTDLSPEEEKIYNYLKTNGKQIIDIIARDCNIPVYKLSNLLFQMEMKGVIRPLPGKIFDITNQL